MRDDMTLSKKSSIPIGRPIANVPHLVFDANMQPIPIGKKGELCVAGPVGLSNGYILYAFTIFCKQFLKIYFYL